MTEQYDLVGWGVVAVDEVFHVPRYPPPDSKVRADRVERRLGGLTAVALAAAADLGGRAAYAGILGRSEPAQFALDALAANGVDLSHVVRRDGAEPVRACIVVAAADGSRTIFYTTDGRVEREPHVALLSLVRRARTILVDPFSLVAAPEVVPAARAAGAQVVADLELEHAERFGDIAPLIDHMVVPLPAALRFAGCDDAREAVRRLAAGRRAAVITMGREGCLFAAGDSPETVAHQSAFAVEARNTTGCGDVFHGAYCLAVARGWPLDECVRFAQAAAAVRAEDSAAPGAVTDARRVAQLLRKG